MVLKALFGRLSQVLAGCFSLLNFSFQLEDEALKYIGAHCPELVTLNLQTCLVSKASPDFPAPPSLCVSRPSLSRAVQTVLQPRSAIGCADRAIVNLQDFKNIVDENQIFDSIQ